MVPGGFNGWRLSEIYVLEASFLSLFPSSPFGKHLVQSWQESLPGVSRRGVQVAETTKRFQLYTYSEGEAVGMERLGKLEPSQVFFLPQRRQQCLH